MKLFEIHSPWMSGPTVAKFNAWASWIFKFKHQFSDQITDRVNNRNLPLPHWPMQPQSLENILTDNHYIMTGIELALDDLNIPIHIPKSTEAVDTSLSTKELIADLGQAIDKYNEAMTQAGTSIQAIIDESGFDMNHNTVQALQAYHSLTPISIECKTASLHYVQRWGSNET